MNNYVKLAKKDLGDANRSNSNADYIQAYALRAIANLMMAEWEEKHVYHPDTGPG